MKKNVASQVVGAQLNSKTDGSAVTAGTTTCYVTGDGGTQAAGSVGSGACTHEGNGFWTYAPAQSETNYDHAAFTFVNSSAVTATVQIYTSFPQTGDNFARLGAPAGASVSADVAAVKAVLPAALVSGRIDASVGAMAANVLTATAIASDAITAAKVADGTIDAATFAVGAINAAAIAADAITDAKVAADVTIASVTGSVGSVTGSVGSVTGNVGGNVTGSVGSVASGGIAAASFAAGAIDAAAIATDALGALELAAGAASEIATAVRTELATELGRVDASISSRLASASYTAPDNATITAIAGYVDTEVGAVKTVTDKLGDLLVADSSPANYRFSAAALALAPTGGSAPSAATIASAVRTELTTELGRVDVAVSTRLATAGYTAPDNTSIAAILVDTAEIGAAGAGLTALASAANLATLTGYVDTEIGAIKAKTDNLPTDPADASDIAAAFATAATTAGQIKAVTDKLNDTLEAANSPANYRFTAQALVNAPAASIDVSDFADALLDESIAAHQIPGSVGEAITDAGAGGNPWNTVLDGVNSAGDMLNVMVAVAAGKASVVAPGNGTATVTFRDLPDTKDVVTATTVQSNRTSVVTNP